jgi:hypothetical protein
VQFEECGGKVKVWLRGREGEQKGVIVVVVVVVVVVREAAALSTVPPTTTWFLLGPGKKRGARAVGLPSRVWAEKANVDVTAACAGL